MVLQVYLQKHVSNPKFTSPGGTGGKEPTCQCRRLKRHEFDPWDDPLEEGIATYSSILA